MSRAINVCVCVCVWSLKYASRVIFVAKPFTDYAQAALRTLSSSSGFIPGRRLWTPIISLQEIFKVVVC